MIGSFCLVKNEAPWIAAHILRALPFLDEMVFLDGNSTDGTLEIIQEIASEHEDGHKIRLSKNQDPRDLKDDYTRLSNLAMRSLSTDLAIFLHPDMYILNPEQLQKIDSSSGVAFSTSVRSFGGEPGGALFEIKGRSPEWKNIYRLRNPDLGAHYFGAYGAWNEDVYFSEITGAKHELHEKFSSYPYQVVPSGVEIFHFSDVRTRERRLSRMVKCLENNKWDKDVIPAKAANHPRVTLKNGDGYTFVPAHYPSEFIEARNKYKHLERNLVHA